MTVSKPFAQTLLYSATSLSVLLGLFVSPLYLAAALVCVTLLALRGDTRQAWLYVAFSTVLLLVGFGYGIGKDMAQRDNRDAQAVAHADQR